MRPSAYRDFWARVGRQFPDLDGAASTRYYAENEQRLFTEHLPPLDGLKILKTDLWDEAKNSRTLRITNLGRRVRLRIRGTVYSRHRRSGY